MIFIKSNNKHKVFKPLQDLNLINSFLFDSSMENPENAKFIAKTIVKRATGRELSSFTVETQKELKAVEPGNQVSALMFSYPFLTLTAKPVNCMTSSLMITMNLI